MRGKRISIGGEERVVELTRDDDALEVSIEGHTTSVEIVDQDAREVTLIVGGRRHIVPYFRSGELLYFNFAGESWTAEISSPLSRKKAEKEHSMSAPMPGSVLRIHVKVGDEVAKGATLITLEAMKMEHQITAPHDGVVASIDCSEGAMVQPGVDLISVDPASAVSGER